MTNKIAPVNPFASQGRLIGLRIYANILEFSSPDKTTPFHFGHHRRAQAFVMVADATYSIFMASLGETPVAGQALGAAPADVHKTPLPLLHLTKPSFAAAGRACLG